MKHGERSDLWYDIRTTVLDNVQRIRYRMKTSSEQRENLIYASDTFSIELLDALHDNQNLVNAILALDGKQNYALELLFRGVGAGSLEKDTPSGTLSRLGVPILSRHYHLTAVDSDDLQRQDNLTVLTYTVHVAGPQPQPIEGMLSGVSGAEPMATLWFLALPDIPTTTKELRKLSPMLFETNLSDIAVSHDGHTIVTRSVFEYGGKMYDFVHTYQYIAFFEGNFSFHVYGANDMYGIRARSHAEPVVVYEHTLRPAF